jgi:hypothetical protein
VLVRRRLDCLRLAGAPGLLLPAGLCVGDSMADVPPLQGPLRGLGWKGKYQYDDPEVVALRGQLEAEAGISGLELIDPQEDDFAEHAARVFHRDGFVLIKDVLDAERIEILRSGCDKVIRHMLAHDNEPDRPRVGNRGSHRYSFGSAPAHFGAQYEWSMMVDPPVLDAVLTAIFGSDQYILGSGLTSGGDFNIPGSVEYQVGTARPSL